MDIRVAEGYALEEGRLVNEATGEIVSDPIQLIVPPGTRTSTPDNRKRNLEAMESRLEREKYYRREGETYFFVRKDVSFEDMPPAMVTKLIYLSTFARFGDNVLMSSQRTKMKRKDLANVLKVSAGGAADFWRTVHPKYVSQNVDGSLTLDTTVFRRGRLPRNAFTPFHQMYDDGIRKLYEAVDGRHLKQLGYLFKLLPYINTEHNLICHNPDEADREQLRLMSASEFCAKIGYDQGNMDKLVKVYSKVRFDVNGRQERFCTLTYNGLETCDAIICINPAIMYSGSNQKREEIERQYFQD